MLARVMLGAKVAALAAATFLCVALGITVLSIRTDVHTTTLQLIATAVQVAETTKQVGAEITADANRLTTRADRLMIVAGATATEAHKAAEYQRAFWEIQTPELARKANLLLDNSNRLVASGTTVLESTNVTILGLNDTNAQVRLNLDQVAGAFAGTAAETQQTVRAFRGLLVDPDFLTMKTNAARMSTGAAQMTEDAAYKFHRYAHPEELTGKAKVWYYTRGTVSFLKDLVMLLYFFP